MESPGCSSESMRLSCGALASPMHLAFHVKASSSTLPLPSPPFEATLPSPPTTRTRWSRHCRRCTWRTLPQMARFDRGGPSRACKSRSCWLRPRTPTPSRNCWLHSRTPTSGRSYWLHSRTPTLEHGGEHGAGGVSRGGAESRQPGPTSRTFDDTSLASASSVIVFLR